MTTTTASVLSTPTALAPSSSPASSPSRSRLWLGRVLTGLPVLFIAFDGLMKFMDLPQVVEATEKIGYHRSALPFLGTVELVAVLLVSIRRTAPFGAVLISAYLGGAVATHVRMGDPLFTHVLAPIYLAVSIWGGLYLRDERVRPLSPFRR
jgi:uncharacterized membrane protein YphA (DoxX/SURF4 family)